MSERRILATCGGWTPARWGDVEFSPLQRYALELTGVTGRRIRIAFVNTASGDQRVDEGRELAAATKAGVDAVHIRLFGRNQPDLHEAVLESDLIWVGGGSAANLLALWRLHQLDAALYEAWASGVLLAGTSAGALCWHVGGPTTTFGAATVVEDALAFVPYSLGVHFDSQPERRPALHRAIGAGELPTGFGLDEGTAVLYGGDQPVEFLTEVSGNAVHRIDVIDDRIDEQRLITRSVA